MGNVGKSLKGVLTGGALIVIGILVLWFNEANDVANIKSVAEGRKNAIDVASAPVDFTNDGKLITISGDIDILSGKITDPAFNVGVDTVKLIRKVEMFQWQEEEKEDADGNVTYTYNLDWSDEVINASDFDESTTHQNPDVMPYEKQILLASSVKIGDFSVTNKQKEILGTSKSIENFNDVVLPDGYVINGKYITNVSTQPKVGDIRISYLYNDDKQASIIGMQQGTFITDYKTDNNKIINNVRSGIHSAAQMLDILESENNMLKWILRAVGYLLILIGFSAILAPIQVLANFVPFLGMFVGAFTGLISLLLGTALACLVIGIAWLAYRPLLGIGLLIASVTSMFLFIKYIKKRKNTNKVDGAANTVNTTNNADYNTNQPMKPVNEVVSPLVGQLPEEELAKPGMNSSPPFTPQPEIDHPFITPQPLEQPSVEPVPPAVPTSQSQIVTPPFPPVTPNVNQGDMMVNNPLNTNDTDNNSHSL